MHVRARAGAGRERLGHERRDRTLPRRKLAGHHPEKRESIGGHECVGIAEIDFILEIGVLVIGLIDTPAQPLQSVVQLAQEIRVRRTCP